jgi:hypothetical protein
MACLGLRMEAENALQAASAGHHTVKRTIFAPIARTRKLLSASHLENFCEYLEVSGYNDLMINYTHTQMAMIAFIPPPLRQHVQTMTPQGMAGHGMSPTDKKPGRTSREIRSYDHRQ